MTQRHLRSCLAGVLWLFTAWSHCLAAGGHGTPLSGWVIGITDGDTLTVLDQQQPVKVRLAYIDAPEKGQPFNSQAKAYLGRLCAGRWAEVTPIDIDRYHRVVGLVRCAQRTANEAMVTQGLAWVYTRYTPTGHPLFGMQQRAREESLGLWQDPLPTPPWEWRRQQRSLRRSAAAHTH